MCGWWFRETSAPRVPCDPRSWSNEEARIRRKRELPLGNALQSVRTAVTVKVREGKVSRTDGPFAETKEQLGGFCLIEAADLDMAPKVAARNPSATTGVIEVPPIQIFG